MMLAEVTDPDYQLEIGLKLHHAGKEDYVENVYDPLGHVGAPRRDGKSMENCNNPLQAGILMRPFRNEDLAYPNR